MQGCAILGATAPWRRLPTWSPPPPPLLLPLATRRTEQGTRLTSTFAPYSQYEVAIPLELAGDCLLEVGGWVSEVGSRGGGQWAVLGMLQSPRAC